MQLRYSKERVFGLDVMRAAAIVLVVAGHCLWIFPNTNSLVSIILQVFSFLGVEIFFVLSGFLIGKILYQSYMDDEYKISTVFHFLKRRWFRTLPSYYLVLVLNVFISYAYFQQFFWKYFLFLQNVDATMPLFFPESWSLAVEEYSYILLPFALFFLSFLMKPKNKSTFFFWIVLLLILSFIITKIIYYLTTHCNEIVQWNSSLKSLVIFRLDSIFIGVLCSWIAIEFAVFWKKHKIIFCLIGFVLLGFLFVGIGYFQILITTFPFFWNVIYLPLVSLAVAFFLPVLSEWKQSNFWFNTPITTISVLSYSIYLLHYSVIMQIMKNYFKIKSDNSIGLFFFIISYFGITFFLSYLMYRFYEKPLMDLRDKN